jgi:hypothetical protein
MKGAYILLGIAVLGLALLVYYLVTGDYTKSNIITALAVIISNAMFFFILRNQHQKK